MSENNIIIRAAELPDAVRIAEIYNAGILSRQATFETVLRSEADIAGWLEPASKKLVLVAVRNGQVAGWASIDSYRSRECYQGIAEYSVYIAPEVQGQGLGLQLLPRLIDLAESKGYWKLLSRIFPENVASLKLCVRCGFREVGIYQKHAKLDDKWRDVVIVERLIETNLK